MQREYSNQPNDLRNDIGSSSTRPNVSSTEPELPIQNSAEDVNHSTIIRNIQSVNPYSMRNNICDVLSHLTPIMNNIRPMNNYRKGIRSFMRRTTTMGETSYSNSPDSFVISFDNIDEAATRIPSEQLNEAIGGRNISEQNPNGNTIFEVESNSLYNSSHEFNEYNNSFPVNDNSNIFNINNNTGNSNDSGNTIGSSITQAPAGVPDAQNPNLNQEVQSINKFLKEYYSLITFLLVKPLYDHREGIFIFAGLIVTFAHSNSVLKREVAKQSRRSLLSLLILFFNLSICICFIYYVFRDQKLYKRSLKMVTYLPSFIFFFAGLLYLYYMMDFSLILIPPNHQPVSIWDLLWMVGITDFILKFITIQMKAAVACFPAKFLPYSSRGKWYLMLESKSQLYRGIAPILPWLYYLIETYQESEKLIGIIFCLVYLVLKGTELLSKGKAFLRALWKLIHNVSLGVRPTTEELEAVGPLCPICHDEYTTPELLHCKHVFCEACIATWFDREQTCPLCRAKVTDVPFWRDGSTTYFTQLF